ncbi:MAG: tRNA (adenosine(37)-N6)-dimethylallyltransferase MiaA [Pseudomonadota bacterium]
MGNQKSQTIHIIAGPTASGKSARAVELARGVNGVIINCDSKQIYNAMPILTAQPSAEEQEDIPHRLYGHLHPNDVCSAGNWREMVEPVIEDVLEAGQTPIICGGTGLYIKALMEGFSPIPDIPQAVRDATNKMHAKLGNPAFHGALKKRDPVMAQRLHEYHTARLIRAWEVIEATGKSLAEWQKVEPIKPPEHWNFEVELIIPERETVRARCHTRFVEMVEQGALEEVEDFQKRIDNGEVRDDIPLARAHGFRFLRSFQRGEISKDEAIEKSVTETRQYAKRQVSWFRNQL